MGIKCIRALDRKLAISWDCRDEWFSGLLLKMPSWLTIICSSSFREIHILCALVFWLHVCVRVLGPLELGLIDGCNMQWAAGK